MKTVLKLTGVLIICLAMQCRCTKQNNQVPYVQIDFSININLPAYQRLVAPGGWEYLQGGANGLIIYRNTSDQWTVLDRQSTFDLGLNCRSSVGEDNFSIEDQCSDSKWMILDGTVIEGPATASLRSYSWNWNDPFLSVTN